MQVIAIPRQYRGGDYERLAIGTSAVVVPTALKLKTAAGKVAQVILITPEGCDIRWRDDAGIPTTGASGNGTPCKDGDSVTLGGTTNAKNAQMIALSGSGVVHIHYYY